MTLRVDESECKIQQNFDTCSRKTIPRKSFIINNMKIVTHSEEENLKVAKNFLEKVKPKDTAVVVGLYGNLGAGKTAFTKAVARNFGIEDIITSPTFVIMKIYSIENKSSRSVGFVGVGSLETIGTQYSVLSTKYFKHLIHIDAYRLEKETELLNLGWEQIISDPQNIIFIEWPERVAGIVPEHIKVRFDTLEDPNSREISIEIE